MIKGLPPAARPPIHLRMLVALRRVFLVLAAAAVVLLGVFWLAPQSRIGRALRQMQQTTPDTAQTAENPPGIAIGGPFTLVDQTGRTVNETSYQGRFLLVYFGYTSCPDICPTMLQTIAVALKALGSKADQVQPVFVTIDPTRDRPDVLARYTALFDPRIIGLTGSAEQIAAIERGYHVYAARVDEPGSNGYLMDHTSFIYLLSPKGSLVSMFDRDTSSTALADGIGKQLQ